MSAPLRVLIVENSEDDAILIAQDLQRGGYDPTFERVDTPEAFSAALARQTWDIIIADYSTPRFSGLDALTVLKESGLDLPFILVSDTIDEDAMVTATKVGAHDCVMKDNLTRLGIAVQRELREARGRLAYRQMEEALKEADQEKENVLDSLLEHVVYEDTTMRILWANRAACESVGLAREELIGCHCYEIWQQRSEPCVGCPVVKACQTGQAQEAEMTTPDGRVWSIRGYPVRDAKGVIVGATEITLEITESKQAEEALRRLKELNEGIIQGMTEGIVVEDADGYYTFVNPAAAALLGYSPAELLGRHWTISIPPDQQSIVRTADERRARGEADRYELQLIRKDGARVFVLVSGSPRFKEGRFVGTLAVFTDITKRKRAEEALELRVEQLAALSQASQAVTASLELDQVLAEIVSLASEVVAVDYTSVVLVDEAGRMGQSAENLPGVPAIEYRVRDEGLTSWIVRSHQAVIIDEINENGTIHPEPDEGAPHTANPLLAETGIKSFAGLPLLVKDRLLGVLYLHSKHASAFRGQLALLTAFANQAAIAIENARLFQAEQQQTRRLALLADVARIAALTLNADELLQAIAKSIHHHFKYPMVGLFTLDDEGQTFTLRGYSGIPIGSPNAVRPGVYHQSVEQGILGHVARTGKPYLASDVRTDPYFLCIGETSIRSELCIPILDEGRVVGAVDVESDRLADFDEEDQSLLEAVADAVATGLRNACLYEEARLRADELAAALARQEELDHLKDEFIQNVSHELRSPLALIRGYAEVLYTGELGELQPAQQKAVAVIARRARMLGDLVQDITVILEAEVSTPEAEPVPLDKLTQTAVEDFQVAARQAKLTLDAEIAPHLPPVSGSPTYLRRVLDNLLGNAIKFTPAGGTVTVRLWQEGDQTALEVSDTGIGIQADQLERIFERFYQVVGSTQRQYGGVGLGLALVKEIVEAYDGRVKVESQVGEGSTFTVLLPIAAKVDVESE